jgi:hypothetical protein
MKKIFSIALLAGALLMVSCNSDMNFDAYNTLPQKNFWQTQADAESAIFACYGKLSDWPFIEPTTFGPEEVASDNTAKGSSPDDQPDINRFKTFTFTPSLDAFNTFWTSRYSLINICNQAITHIPDISMDETYKKQLLGEARFIRAWTYFELVRMFGEVVIYDGIPANGAYNIAKSSVEDIYKFILGDLEYGYANMQKTQWATQWKGRVTAWAARALEAKVLMYMASGANFMEDGKAIGGKTWSDVKTVTDDVINNGPYSLYTAKGDSSFFYMYRFEGENCDESIFEVQNGASKSYGDINRCAYAVYRWVRGDNDNGGGWGLDVPTDGLVADWQQRTDDTIRFHASIAFRGDRLSDGTTVGGLTELSGTNAGKPGYPPARYSMKAYVPKNDQTQLSWIYGIEQNIRLLRFSDILLIDAEARLNLGDKDGARISINKVRNRVKETPYANADLTFQKIWDERRFELAFENDRFFDLVRTGLAKTVLGSQGFVFPKHVFYPLPQAQIDLSNGILVQNKNY